MIVTAFVDRYERGIEEITCDMCKSPIKPKFDDVDPTYI